MDETDESLQKRISKMREFSRMPTIRISVTGGDGTDHLTATLIASVRFLRPAARICGGEEQKLLGQGHTQTLTKSLFLLA